jgi:membrane protease YdiL (CAAX protease family)
MKRKALYAYAGLILLSICSFVFPHRAFTVFLPAYMVAVPLLLGARINISFSARDIGLGLAASAAVLVPFVLVFTDLRALRAVTVHSLMVRLFLVSLPEEAFFRGFLQEVFSNDLRAVLIVSVFFGVAHLPAVAFQGELTALLTFFPSLVMGLLYMKTSNIVPSTVFHFLADVAFSAFVI